MERTLGSSSHFAGPASAHPTVNLFSHLMLWQRRISTRRELARLDSRLLADAGISEAQRYDELSKPFWR